MQKYIVKLPFFCCCSEFTDLRTETPGNMEFYYFYFYYSLCQHSAEEETKKNDLFCEREFTQMLVFFSLVIKIQNKDRRRENRNLKYIIYLIYSHSRSISVTQQNVISTNKEKYLYYRIVC